MELYILMFGIYAQITFFYLTLIFSVVTPFVRM